MKDNIENIIKKADFSKGSNQKEELRKKLFGDGNDAKIVKYNGVRELSDDELGLISAAGLYEEQYKDKKDGEQAD